MDFDDEVHAEIAEFNNFGFVVDVEVEYRKGV